MDSYHNLASMTLLVLQPVSYTHLDVYKRQSFPFTAVLIKKGAKFSNVIIFMNAWCLTKISTLLFEFSALGLKFTLVRLIIDIPGVLIVSYFVSLLTPKNELEKIYNEK